MTHWPTVSLGDVASFARSAVDPATQAPDTNYIGLEHIPTGGGEPRRSTLGDHAPASTKFAFDHRHVLFGKLRPNLGKVAWPGYSGVCSTDILPILPGARLHAGYLAWFLRRPQTTAWAASRAKGANLPRLSPSELIKLRVPLPPIEEQRGVAAVLDQADALRVQRQTAISASEELVGALYREMVVDHPERAQWASRTVVELASRNPGAIRTGPFGSQLLHSEFTDSGVAVLGIDNAVADEFQWGKPRFVSEAKYTQLKRYTVHPGDVLITIMGTCGRCAVVPDDIPVAINTKHLCCITLDRAQCSPTFLWAAFRFDPEARSYLQRHAKGAVMAGLNMGIIKRLPVRVPPLPVQAAFERAVGAVHALRAAQRSAQDQLDSLFVALADRAFAGGLTGSVRADADGVT